MARSPPDAVASRVLIFRMGSLGDTVVALPCFHLVARAFPGAERRVLTNAPVAAKAAPVMDVLGGSGLVHGAIAYPQGTRSPAALYRLRQEIRAFAPEVLVYMTEWRGRAATWRDLAFFRTCGIDRIVGAPTTEDLARPRILAKTKMWESEASRLARCLAPLGDAQLDRRESWDLHLDPRERAEARAALAGWPGTARYLVMGAGTKIEAKDWGEENWRRTAQGLARPGWGLVLVGSADEAPRADAIARVWGGLTRNLCGTLSPRASAAVIEGARLYLGHDSGPMHVAAALGVPIVAVFSARNKPGVWYPQGAGHAVLYNQTDCFGCELTRCIERGKACLNGIAPEAVVAAASQRMDAAERRP